MRVVAFVGIALVDPFVATVRPRAAGRAWATRCSSQPRWRRCPSLVAPERAAAATSLYGAITDFGFTAGPAMTAAGLLLIDPEGVMLVNGVTFGDVRGGAGADRRGVATVAVRGGGARDVAAP